MNSSNKIKSTIILMLMCNSVLATQLTFTATVDSVDDQAGLLGGKIQVGTTLTGTVSVDDANQGTSYYFDPQCASFPYGACGAPLAGWDYNTNWSQTNYDYSSTSIGSIEVLGNGLTFRTVPSAVNTHMQINNNNAGGQFDNIGIASDNNEPLPNGTKVNSIAFGLLDFSHNPIATTAVDAVKAINLANWDQTSVSVFAQPDFMTMRPGMNINAHITSVQYAPIAGATITKTAPVKPNKGKTDDHSDNGKHFGEYKNDGHVNCDSLRNKVVKCHN